ncbi:MAG: hypothetical protein AAGE52_15965 [Myxococcota bacterium]
MGAEGVIRWLSLCVVLVGCGRAPQVVLVVDADPVVAQRAQWIRVQIFSLDDDARVSDLREPLQGRDGASLPVRIPLRARNGDPDRRFEVYITLHEDEPRGERPIPILHERVRARYVPDRVVFADVRLETVCLDRLDCGEGRTCRDGQCVGACYSTRREDDPVVPGPLCSVCERCTESCVPLGEETPCGACEQDRCRVGPSGELECQAVRRVREVATAQVHTCAVQADVGFTQSVTCFGADEFGALGVGPAESDRCRECTTSSERSCRDCLESGDEGVCLDCGPTRAIADLNARTVAVAGLVEGNGRTAYSCVLAESSVTPGDREIFCAGSGGPRLGLGNLGDEPVREPRRVGEGVAWGELSLAHDHACALDDAQGLFCWGRNQAGQLGTGDRVDRPEPVPLPGRWSSVSTGRQHTCALDVEEGSVSCWGDNTYRQLGVDMMEVSVADRPMRVLATGPFTAVAAGSFSTCALQDAGSVVCWGSNDRGQLGRLPLGGFHGPAPIESERTFRALDCGRSHCCALSDESDLYCWGWNTQGQLGIGALGTGGTSGDESLGVGIPRLIAQGPWESLSAGFTSTCAVRRGGRLFCWGDNRRGQLAVDAPVVVVPQRVCLP